MGVSSGPTTPAGPRSADSTGGKVTSEAQSAITAVRRSHERLQAVVEPLAADQLRGRSYATDWTIAQVLSHLGSGAQISALVLDAALAGRPAPDPTIFADIWATWNAKTPDQQASDALPADRVLVEAYEALDVDQHRQLRVTFGPMELDAAGMARLRLGEHAVHTWDVAVALDPAATVDGVAVGELIDGLGMLVGFVAKPTGKSIRLRVTTHDPEREIVLDVDDSVQLAGWDGHEQLPRLALPAEAFLRLVYGRLDPDHTPPTQADGVDLDQLRMVFPGF